MLRQLPPHFITSFQWRFIRKIKLDKKTLGNIVRKVEEQDKFFAEKSYLDTLSYSVEIVGREVQAEALVRYLIGYKKGHAVPLVSVYGRSGSGKSTIVRYVCENLEGISSCIVNLRTVNTSFGCANLILDKLGEPHLKSAHGINAAISKIEEAIISKLENEGKNFLVLVLDEFDALFYNKREKPSDFVYKLLVMQEHLKEKGLMMSVICVSNNALAQYELDDRIKSRIGSSDVFFEPYSKEYVVKILSDRIKKALADKVDRSVIEYCAEISSLDHGDARRAIDLLRAAAEVASKNKEKILQLHVDKAVHDLQTGRTSKIVRSASFQFKTVCFCLARLSYLTNEAWHSTSTIYRQYRGLLSKETKPLGYRRVSEYLVEIANTGIAESHTGSRGRRGYGTSYRLTILPEILGRIIQKDMWKEISENKAKHEDMLDKNVKRKLPNNDYYAWERYSEGRGWKEYVGV